MPCGLSRSEKPSAGSQGRSHLSQWRSRNQNVLEPIQVGVRTSHQTEGNVHAARHWMNRHSNNPNNVVVLVDIRNAFNCVDWSAVKHSVWESLPRKCAVGRPVLQISFLSRHWRQYHRQYSRSPTGRSAGSGPLLLGHPSRHSQGSQLDPLSVFPDSVDLSPFFLDDGVLVGDAPAISSFLRHLITGLASIGLNNALDKTEVLPASFSLADFPGCAWNSSRNFKLLGTAI